MTDTAELSELEQAIAEAELTDDEAQTVRELVENGGDLVAVVAWVLKERDPEPEPEPAEAPAEIAVGEPSRRQITALRREVDRHLAKVREIMGAHVAGMEPCSKCDGMGLEPPIPQPQGHEYFHACETCNGYGEVLTGALRAGHESRDCPTCKGRGYVEALDAAGAPLAERTGAPPAPEPVPVVTTTAHELAPPPEQAGAVTFGTPAWMGNVSLGQ